MTTALPTANPALSPEVLLVDDDELVTRSLCRYLRSARPHWQIRTATSASTALQALKLNPADVCISDVEMAGMNGVQLLGEVSSKWPSTIRILYCGDFEQTRRIDGAQVAHQVLSKSSDPTSLIDAVDQALQSSLSVSDRNMWRLLSQEQMLPPAPRVFLALEQAMRRGNARMKDLTAIIAQDDALVQRMLQLGGCAWLGLPVHLRTLDGAVGWLGLLTVRGLTLSAEAFRGLSGDAPIGPVRLTHHGFQVAELAARVARDMCPSHTETAYLAATVHDIGRLLLGTRDRTAYEAVLEHANRENVPLPYAERTLMGTTHADVGATLLETWGVSDAIVQAVRAHHTPPSSSRWNAGAALFVANGLLDEANRGARLQPEHCGRIRAPEARWTAWRELAGLPV